MKRTLVPALALMMSSGAAIAGSCEDMVDSYNSTAAPNDKIDERTMRDKVFGCVPGGSLDLMDKALRDNEARCAAGEYRDYQATHPNWKGCEPIK
jgi:hypothetical protein